MKLIILNNLFSLDSKKNDMDLGPYLLFASLEGLVHATVLSLIALGLSLVWGNENCKRSSW